MAEALHQQPAAEQQCPSDADAVLDEIMADGTFDELRQQLVLELKQNVRPKPPSEVNSHPAGQT